MSANDKLAATFGPGRTTPTPTLGTRIAEVLAAHKAIGLRGMGLRGPDVIADCKCGVEVTGGPEGMRAHQAAALAPVIKEAQARVLTEFADAHRMPEPMFMDGGRAITVGDLLREKAAQIRSNDE